MSDCHIVYTHILETVLIFYLSTNLYRQNVDKSVNLFYTQNRVENYLDSTPNKLLGNQKSTALVIS
jgi:hypothetical protein